MRKAIVGIAISGVLVMSMAAGASAAPRYGQVIKQQCGMPYGRIVVGIWRGQLEPPPVRLRGARFFVTSGLIDLYCPVETEEPQEPEEPEEPDYPEVPES